LKVFPIASGKKFRVTFNGFYYIHLVSYKNKHVFR